MEVFVITALGILGLSLGSFVNAWVWRIKTGRSVAKGRSMCPHCKHQLAANDLVPVLSWLALKGRCRYCKKPISSQYPLVELSVMAYFVGSYLAWPEDLVGWYAITLFIFWLIYGVLLAALFVYDLKWQLLPDKIVKPFIGLAFIQAMLVQTQTTPVFYEALLNIAFSLLPIAGLYYLLYIISKGRWVGFGDVKLGIGLGLVLGWQAALVCLVLANFIGLLIVLPGLISKNLNRTSRVPFGPFLILAFIAAGLWGQRLIDWYVGGLFISV